MLKMIFDMQYKMLEKYPALQPLKPLVEAGDNFFYGPAHLTGEKTHARDGIDIKRFMITVLFAVLPTAAAAVYFYGLRALVVILVSYIAGGIAEVLFCIVRKEDITEGFLVTGILYPLILPASTPLWMVAVGIIVGVILGKEVFGGSGRNPFNAALVGRCFLYISFPLQMTGGAFVEPIEAFKLETAQVCETNCKAHCPLNFGKPIEFTKGGFVKYMPDAKTQATPLSAQKAMRLTHAEEQSKESYQAYIDKTKELLPSTFWGNCGGSMGETSALLILLGGLLLIITRVANWRTIVSSLFAAGLFGYLLYGGQTFEDRIYLALFTLLSGGMLFGCVFMATDPVTGPATHQGRYVYGFAIGAIAVVIRRFSGYPEGVMFAILLMNVFASLIDEIVIMVRYREAKQ